MLMKDETNVTSPVYSSSRVLPASNTVSEACCIPFGFVYDPTVTLHSAPGTTTATVNREVARCKVCGAYINKFVKLTALAWSCVFCNTENKLAGSGTTRTPDTPVPPELVNDTYEFVLSQPGKPAQPDTGSGTATKHVLFIIDDYLETADKLVIFNSIVSYVKECSDDTLLSLYLMSSVVNIFMLGKQQSADTIQTEAFSGNSSMTNDLTKYLAYHGGDMVGKVSTCRNSLLEVLETVCTGLRSKNTLLTGDKNPFITSKNRRGLRRTNRFTPKCLGFALELTLALFNQDAKSGGMMRHIVILTGGCVSHGPGAVSADCGEFGNVHQSKQYFASLGVALAKVRGTVHLQCIGHDVFGIVSMETMLENCGGTLIMQKDLTEDISADFVSCIDSIVGCDSVVRLQTTPNTSLEKIVTVAVTQHDKPLFTKRYPVLNRSKKISATFRISNKLNYKPVYLQCTNCYTAVNTANKCIRVSTIRYDCTTDYEEIVSAVCADTAFTLCAREYLQLLHLREETDDLLVRQAHTLVSNSENSVNKKSKMLIEMFLEKLYYMTHGPMVSRMLQHQDDKDYVLQILLHGDVSTATHLVKPKVYSVLKSVQEVGGRLTIVEYPPLTLVFRPDRLLVLDIYTEIYVWIGHKTQARSDVAELLDQTHVFLKHLCKERFPRPRITVLHDNTSMNRFVECYLMPVHKDSKEIQLSLLPELADLSDAEYEALVNKYNHVQYKTFNQWLSEMRVVAVGNLAS